ncbi:hypothetical protein [Polynucleobacter sp. HIN5]|uniref:hypothetical protein n=1 Tax=Polynucleobacter sp. HIN5 TaxID=3047864 RepID=UPI0025748366|nr:hypothetical protein [Polynucleobacter sp. HIN5]BEI33209.1 hypothetical protein PHIN5_05770 [Polynucleobacter sp. HIN5]
MLSFKEWLTHHKINPIKRKKKKNEFPFDQGAGEIWSVDKQGEATRAHQKVQSSNVHVFPEA